MAINAAVAASLRSLAGTGVALSGARSDHGHTLISGGSGSAYPGALASGADLYNRSSFAIAALGTYSVTVNINCNSGRVFGVAVSWGTADAMDAIDVQLYIDGVWISASSLGAAGSSKPICLTGFRTVGVGVIPVRCDLYNLDFGAPHNVMCYGAAAGIYRPLMVAGGEVRI